MPSIAPEMSQTTPFGTRLRTLRQQQGLTLAQLGAKVGVSRQCIHHWEISVVRPNLLTRKRLAVALHVPLDELSEGLHVERPIYHRFGTREAFHAFARRLMRARIELGLSVHDLAGKSAISPVTLRNFEAGLRVPREKTIHRLAVALDVPVTDLWFRPRRPDDLDFTRKAG